MSGYWLDLSSTSNLYIRTYMNGFLDMSGGNLMLRNNNLLLKSGDASLGGRLFVAADSSLNGNLTLGGNLVVNGDFTVKEFTQSSIINTITTNVFNVSEDLSLNGRFFASGDASLNGRLYVRGNTTLTNGLSVSAGTVSFPAATVSTAALTGTLATIGSTAISAGVTTTTVAGLTLTSPTLTGTSILTSNTTYTNVKLYVSSPPNVLAYQYYPNSIGNAYYDGTNWNVTSDGINRSFSNTVYGWQGQYMLVGTLSGASPATISDATMQSYIRMSILSSGNVGIGTTSPAGKLHIDATNGALSGGDPTYRGDIILTSQSSGVPTSATGGIEFKLSNSGPGYGWRIMASDSTSASAGTPFTIQNRVGSASWTNQLLISNDGKVGIGTTNPQYTLDVAGTLSADGLNTKVQKYWNSLSITFGITGGNASLTTENSYILLAKWTAPATATGGVLRVNGTAGWVSEPGKAAFDFYITTRGVIKANGNVRCDDSIASFINVCDFRLTSDANYCYLYLVFKFANYVYFDFTVSSSMSTTSDLMTPTTTTVSSTTGTTQISSILSNLTNSIYQIAGNVGIGTTNPAYKLDIRASNLSATTGTNVSQTMLIGGDYGTTGSYIGTSAGYLQGGTMYSQTTFLALGTGWGTSGVTLTERMRIVDTGNVGIGTTNPTKMLTVAGDALINGLTVGRGTSTYVTNTAFGTSALNANTSDNNTAFGYFALKSNIGGDANTAVGENALQANTTGYRNTAVGAIALKMNTGGHWNTAVGSFALRDNATGQCNTAVGAQAGYQTNTTGSNNTYLGYNANANANNLSNSTAIGASATITASNQIVLGTATESVKIPGSLSVAGSMMSFISVIDSAGSTSYPASQAQANTVFGTVSAYGGAFTSSSLANNTITIPVAGNYYIIVSVSVAGPTGATVQCILNITKNAASTLSSTVGSTYAGQWMSLNISGIFTLAANDVIAVPGNTGGAYSIISSPYKSTLTIIKM